MPPLPRGTPSFGGDPTPSVAVGTLGRPLLKFKPKQDLSAYKTYKSILEFIAWKETWVSTARAQGLAILFDPNFNVHPSDPDHIYWLAANAWMYDALRQKVLVTTGKRIVRQHLVDYDCRAIMIELELDASTSTQGRISLHITLREIVNTKLTPDYRGSYVDFLTDFEKKVSNYNEQQHITTPRSMTS